MIIAPRLNRAVESETQAKMWNEKRAEQRRRRKAANVGQDTGRSAAT